MARVTSKSARKLVTLPAELAERVEKFRESSGAASESDALKTLIEDGLKLRDRSSDLFARFESATQKGQNIGEIINLFAADHPLVHSTYLNQETLTVYLKVEQDQQEERFTFDRLTKGWDWQRRVGTYGDDQWESIKPGSLPKRRPKTTDLDDEIPF
jgi:hypothetical protein